MSSARRCVGAILAGGAAGRFGGRPKGLEVVGDRRIADRVADALREATDSLMVVANDDAAAAWMPGVPVVPDRIPGRGPLAGVAAALDAASRGAAAPADILVVAWDLPFVPSALLRALRDAGESSEADAAVPRSTSPWGFEPLCAWYAAGALTHVAALVDSGDGRAGALAGRARVLTVDVSSWGDADRLFFSVNTPEDLARARALAAGAST